MTEPGSPAEAARKTLLAAAAAGDGDAFADLLAPHRAALFAYLVRDSGSRDAAEDLLQETLIRCWRGLPRYQDRGKFAAWLFAVGRNAARDWRRQRSRDPATFAAGSIEPELEPAVAPEAASRIEVQQLQARLREILQSLPEERREVFLLRQHGDLSFREIAELLDRPLGTVLSHMHRAVKQIKEGLAGHDA